MKRATVIARFHSSIEAVWNIVTDNTAFDWRSDKDRFETEFTIVLKKPYERYEFDMKNKNMDGHWIGLFSRDGSGTKIGFTEEVEVANPIMNLFVRAYLKKQQATYITDLRKAMGE